MFEEHDYDPLRPSRGCLNGLLIGLAFWIVVIVALILLGWMPWI